MEKIKLNKILSLLLMIRSSFLTVIFSSLLLISCNEYDETANRQSSSQDTTSKKNEPNIENYSNDFRELIKTTGGIFRGVRLGLSKEGIKNIESKYENSKLEEETESHLDYMVDFGSLENTDLRYTFNEHGNLIVIEVNIYPNSKESQDSLFTEFQSYFNQLYGASTSTKEGHGEWEQKSNDLFIQMQKRDTQKIHDISIVFSYLSRHSAGALMDALPEEY